MTLDSDCGRKSPDLPFAIRMRVFLLARAGATDGVAVRLASRPILDRGAFLSPKALPRAAVCFSPPLCPCEAYSRLRLRLSGMSFLL